jgi:hypothetical protein
VSPTLAESLADGDADAFAALKIDGVVPGTGGIGRTRQR